ncbi:unnamed protein product [Urochloa humidicola]
MLPRPPPRPRTRARDPPLEASPTGVVERLAGVIVLPTPISCAAPIGSDVRRAARQDHLRGTLPVRGHGAGDVVPDPHAATLLVGVEGLDAAAPWCPASARRREASMTSSATAYNSSAFSVGLPSRHRRSHVMVKVGHGPPSLGEIFEQQVH